MTCIDIKYNGFMQAIRYSKRKLATSMDRTITAEWQAAGGDNS